MLQTRIKRKDLSTALSKATALSECLILDCEQIAVAVNEHMSDNFIESDQGAYLINDDSSLTEPNQLLMLSSDYKPVTVKEILSGDISNRISPDTYVTNNKDEELISPFILKNRETLLYSIPTYPVTAMKIIEALVLFVVYGSNEYKELMFSNGLDNEDVLHIGHKEIANAVYEEDVIRLFIRDGVNISKCHKSMKDIMDTCSDIMDDVYSYVKTKREHIYITKLIGTELSLGRSIDIRAYRYECLMETKKDEASDT